MLITPPFSMDSLREIMKLLRSSQGCPWDREQTHTSLTRYLVEETYEVLEAIDQDNPAALTDELGDVLLQVVFHAQIASEQNTFTIDDVIDSVCRKLIRRHPHVFADTEVDSVSDVVRNWEAIKKDEALVKNRTSLLDGIPAALPALLKAEKAQSKTAKVGFEWDSVDGALEKLSEELHELQQAIKQKAQPEMKEELGDVLFCMVNIARYLNICSESALNQTTEKFIARFRLVEMLAEQAQQDLNTMTLAEMDVFWDQAKDHLRKKPQ